MLLGNNISNFLAFEMKSRIKQNSVSYTASLAVLSGRLGSIIFLSLAVVFLLMTFVRPGLLSGTRVSVTDVFAPALSAISQPFQNMAAAVSSISESYRRKMRA